MTVRILLVDDNDLNLDMLSRLLTPDAVSRLTSPRPTAGNAWSGRRATVPDLILLDMSLPVVSGWDAVVELKADERAAGVPVIAPHRAFDDERPRTHARGGL